MRAIHLDPHLPSGHDVGDDVLRRRVRVHAVGPLTDRHHVATLLRATKKSLLDISKSNHLQILLYQSHIAGGLVTDWESTVVWLKYLFLAH